MEARTVVIVIIVYGCVSRGFKREPQLLYAVLYLKQIAPLVQPHACVEQPKVYLACGTNFRTAAVTSSAPFSVGKPALVSAPSLFSNNTCSVS